jgi:predicted  nucleic acid-binding Zn-ribbon protein
MSPGEVRRTLERIERAQSEAQKASDDRMSELARKTVPAELWAAQHRALEERVARNEQDAREARDRIERAVDARFVATGKEIAAVVKAFEDHEEDHQAQATWSRSKTLTVVGIAVGAIATIAAAWITALLAAKGVH